MCERAIPYLTVNTTFIKLMNCDCVKVILSIGQLWFFFSKMLEMRNKPLICMLISVFLIWELI